MNLEKRVQDLEHELARLRHLLDESSSNDPVGQVWADPSSLYAPETGIYMLVSREGVISWEEVTDYDCYGGSV